MRKTPARRRKGSNWKVYVCLLFCFPYGLFLMWRTTRWHPAVKGLVTTCFAALTLAILLPLTSPPERLPGGVYMVSAERDVEVFGPELPEALDANYTGYSAVTSSNGPVFSEETTTQTTYVYANDNGKFYHNLDCEYVQWYSKKYALAVAYYNGYLPCVECGAPTYTPGSSE